MGELTSVAPPKMIAIQKGSPIARQARLLFSFCQRSKSTQFLNTSNQVHIGGQTRSFRVGFVSQEKGENSSNDVEDKFKDDKFKDDPDVRGILSDIKGHFDPNYKGINVTPNEEPVANGDEYESDSSRGESIADNGKEEEGSGGGAKSMKELLEKIYGARTKAATQTSVGGYTEYR